MAQGKALLPDSKFDGTERVPIRPYLVEFELYIELIVGGGGGANQNQRISVENVVEKATGRGFVRQKRRESGASRLL